MENNIPENRNPQNQAPRPAAPRPAAQRPAASTPQRPAASAPQRPAAIAPQRPTANAPQRPAASAPHRPAASAPQRPASNAPQRPAANVPQRPAASAPQRPAASSPQRPAASSAQRPAASSAQRPIQNNAPIKPVQPPMPPKASDTPEAENPTQSTASAPAKEGAKKKTTLSKAGAEMMSSAVKALIYIAAVFVVAIFLSIIIIRVGNDVFALVKSDEVIDITIPEEAKLSDVANILHENSIISFPGLFTMYGNMKKDNGVFIAGDYSVSPAMSYDDLRAAFKPQPVTGTSWITIPEGYTVDEFIALMESYGIGEREKYIDVINNYEFDYWFVKEIPEDPNRHYRLEGYLFPDTYEFYNSSSEVTVINKLLARFEEVFVDAYREKAAELGMSVDDIITIASLIEKEAGTAADYRYVSSVFHNRLAPNSGLPYLQSDVTYFYYTENIEPFVDDPAASDAYLSAYYTYPNYKAGLPVGPICNPGLNAIKAALYPANTNYYFFVTDFDGNFYYGATQAEHDANVIKAGRG